MLIRIYLRRNNVACAAPGSSLAIGKYFNPDLKPGVASDRAATYIFKNDPHTVMTRNGDQTM